MRLSSFFMVFLIAASVSGAASAGKLRGKLVVGSKYIEWLNDQEREAESARRASYWRTPNGVLPIRPLDVAFDNEVAVVLRREDGKPEKPDKVKTVDVLAGKLEPTVVVTHPGSTLRFKNVDPFEHELYSPGLTDFQPDRQTQGSFRPIDFPQEGTFEVRCRLMPNFLGYVVVTPAEIVAQVKKDGTFSMEDIEEGKYTVQVFHRGKWIATQKVDVEDGRRNAAFVEIEFKPPSAREDDSQEKGADTGEEKK